MGYLSIWTGGYKCQLIKHLAVVVLLKLSVHAAGCLWCQPLTIDVHSWHILVEGNLQLSLQHLLTGMQPAYVLLECLRLSLLLHQGTGKTCGCASICSQVIGMPKGRVTSCQVEQP